MKYVVVSGGVVSSVGKGVITSSTGVLIQACGYTATVIKIDPYLNIDAGCFSPYEHGEAFVLDDGGETDLDLGNYERFLNLTLTRDHNITTGKIYQQVIEKERRGDYLGKTVQIVPHVTNHIIEWIEKVAQVPSTPNGPTPDVCLIELGGTVGDIESAPFVEALRQLKYRVGAHNFCNLYVSLIPTLGVVGERKTKPTQHGVRDVRALGLEPDLLMCRSETPLDSTTLEKLALFCHLPTTNVISVHDLSNLFHVPVLLQQQGVAELVIQKLALTTKLGEGMNIIGKWRDIAEKVDTTEEEVVIGIVGKYCGLADAYRSVLASLSHAAISLDRKTSIKWIDSSHLEMEQQDSEEGIEAWKTLRSVDCILVPGGFGTRGVEGKIRAAEYARTERKPYLGLCLGFQVLTIEFARHVAGLEDAHTAEINEDTPHPVIAIMPCESSDLGGTMRLGAHEAIFSADYDSILGRYYGVEPGMSVFERHRHRYEVNPDYVDRLEEAGLRFVARDLSGTRMEVAELPSDVHPFYCAVQYHPEYTSRPSAPSPPFVGLVEAAIDYKSSH